MKMLSTAEAKLIDLASCLISWFVQLHAYEASGISQRTPYGNI